MIFVLRRGFNNLWGLNDYILGLDGEKPEEVKITPDEDKREREVHCTVCLIPCFTSKASIFNAKSVDWAQKKITCVC